MSLGPSAYPDLAAVIEADEFPEVDLALRRGRHIARDDASWYAFLTDAQAPLEALYRRYGCELVHRSDGYFYLLPSGDKLPRRQLAAGDMLVGQALALLYLDPATVQSGGTVERDEVLAQLDGILGSDALIRAFHPRRRRIDERVAQETVRRKVAEAIRRLAGLGFVDLLEADRLRLRPPLLRFAEPARGAGSPAEALAKLLAKGEVVMLEDEDDDVAGAERGPDAAGDPEGPAAAAAASHEAEDRGDEAGN
jgi:chromosome partition protein MukE